MSSIAVFLFVIALLSEIAIEAIGRRAANHCEDAEFTQIGQDESETASALG